MYKGKGVVLLFKPPSKKHFKRSNAKLLDLEKEIGDLPLSQSSQDGSTQVHSMQVCTTQPKCQIHKTETITSKKVHLLDLLEKMDVDTKEINDTSTEYTTPFTDISEYQKPQVIKVPKRFQISQEEDACKSSRTTYTLDSSHISVQEPFLYGICHFIHVF